MYVLMNTMVKSAQKSQTKHFFNYNQIMFWTMFSEEPNPLRTSPYRNCRFASFLVSQKLEKLIQPMVCWMTSAARKEQYFLFMLHIALDACCKKCTTRKDFWISGKSLLPGIDVWLWHHSYGWNKPSYLFLRPFIAGWFCTLWFICSSRYAQPR